MAVAEFVRLFAHELNNPLATLRMSAEMLQAGTLPPEMEKEILDVVFNETLRMEALIEQAVYYTAIPPANPLMIEIPQLVDSVIESAAVDLPVSLRNEFGSEPVLADALQIAKLLRELVANAAQSGASKIDLEICRDGEDVIFRVSDDGDGISSTARPKIFQPFYTTREGRLGLGLSTAKRIAELHGGSIDVAEAAPSGTIVSIRIPNSVR